MSNYKTEVERTEDLKRGIERIHNEYNEIILGAGHSKKTLTELMNPMRAIKSDRDRRKKWWLIKDVELKECSDKPWRYHGIDFNKIYHQIPEIKKEDFNIILVEIEGINYTSSKEMKCTSWGAIKILDDYAYITFSTGSNLSMEIKFIFDRYGKRELVDYSDKNKKLKDIFSGIPLFCSERTAKNIKIKNMLIIS